MTPTPVPLRTSATLLSSVLLAATAISQGPASLVKDIRTSPTINVDGACTNFASIGGRMYFAATELATGQELWVSDGTPAGTQLLMDINPGPANSVPYGFVDIGGGVILFQATDAASGQELWRTDGTAAGTYQVKDIRTGTFSGMQFNPLVVMGGIAFFQATDSPTSSNNFELWRSDGTAAGTFLVKEINPSPTTGGSPSDITVLGNQLVFRASDGSTGSELWISDGTPAGTSLVLDIQPGTGSGSPGPFTPYLGRLLFPANNGTTGTANGTELWVTDGTPGGTTMLLDIRAGTASSFPSGITVYGAHAYFTANDGTNGSELWRTDGTPVGTVMFMDINPGSAQSFPGFLTQSNGKLFFAATDATNGGELWVTDGTTTTFLGDLNPGTTSSGPTGLIDAGGIVVFRANVAGFGQEPFRSDGTPAGTYRLVDINPGSPNSSPSFLIQFQNRAFFMANEPLSGNKLWVTDGSIAGTALFKDTNPPTTGCNAVNYTDMRNASVTLFAADDGVNGPELWRSDGTAAGTGLVRDINPTAGAGSSPANFAVVGTKVFFVATDGTAGRELWVTDGTAAGTNLVLDIMPGSTPSNPFSLVEFRNLLYFSANDGVNGTELWSSDGTPAGTVRITDINTAANGSSSPSTLTVVKDRLFFAASNGTAAGFHGTELWVSDGTTAGTSMVMDINPGTASSSPATLFNYNDVLLFTAGTSAGRELWRSDGTLAGTVMVLDILPGSTSSVPNFLGVVNGLLMMSATTTANGIELWATDGTPGGTFLVKDILAGPANSNPVGFAVVNGVGVFFASDGVAGMELWRTDGTASGTNLVKDIAPGGNSSINAQGFLIALGSGNRALFAASDGATGVELWRTDGTAAGTVLHQDIAAGPIGSNPSRPVQAGSLLFFNASDLTSGAEPWVMSSNANAEPWGFACAGTGGRFPHIGAVTAPVLGNGAFGVSVRNGLPLSASVVLVHLQRGDLPLGGGCTYYGDPIGLFLVGAVATDGSGYGAYLLPIPNDPTLAGGKLFAQHLVLDPAGSFMSQLAFTEGLKIVLAAN